MGSACTVKVSGSLVLALYVSLTYAAPLMLSIVLPGYMGVPVMVCSWNLAITVYLPTSVGVYRTYALPTLSEFCGPKVCLDPSGLVISKVKAHRSP